MFYIINKAISYYLRLKFKKNLRNKQLKIKIAIGFQWEAKTKKAKVDYFTKNLYASSVFEQWFKNFLRVIIDL